MFNPQTLPDTPSATSFAESRAGHAPSSLPKAQPGVCGLANGVPDGFPAACPKLYPLATGQTSRAAKLKLLGNAIVPQVAAAFIRATLEAHP